MKVYDILLYYLIAFVSTAAFGIEEEVYFEREVTAEEKNGKFLDEINYFSDPKDIPGMKARKWGPEVVRVQVKLASHEKNAPHFINDPAYSIKDGTPFVNILYLAENLYVTSRTKEELDRYQIRTSRSAEEKRVTAAQIREKYAVRNVSDKVVSVVLKYEGITNEPPYLRPIIETKLLGSLIADVEASKKRVADLKARFAIGKNYAGYKYLGAVVSYDVLEAYQDEKKRVNVEQYMVGSDGEYEFIRRILANEIRMKKTEWGAIAESRVMLTRNPMEVYACQLAWLAKDGHVLIITATAVGTDDPCMDIFPLYAERFSSVLSNEFKVDRLGWIREETTRKLAEVQRLLKQQPQDRDRIDECFSDLNRLIFFPAFENGVPDIELSKLYEQIQKWWDEQSGTIKWDKDLKKFVAPGQAPSDLKWNRQQAEEKRKEDLLNAPLKDEGILKSELIAIFEKCMNEKIRDSDPKYECKFEKNKDESWDFKWKYSFNTPLVDHTIRGPYFLRSKTSLAFPIRGEFVTSSINKGQLSQRPEYYYYDKLRETWTRDEPKDWRKPEK